MKNANISEIRDNLSKYLRTVRKGETVIICDRATPIARLEPIPPMDKETASQGRALTAGVLIPPRVVDDVLRNFLPPKKSKQPAELVEALLEERRSGR